MDIGIAMADLLEYTDWERRKWLDWLRRRGGSALGTNVGPHGDGRFKTVGELVRHIFSAEKRYVERLSDLPLTDPGTIPANEVEALFRFGQESRQALRRFIETLPAEEWEVMNEFSFFNTTLFATPRKIVTHVLLHEIRHWAQIATLLRLNGMTDDFHDFLFSPVMGGELRREPQKV